ncbi:MAG: tetratricopeptide repeat protein [Halieaceae bacterium]
MLPLNRLDHGIISVLALLVVSILGFTVVQIVETMERSPAQFDGTPAYVSKPAAPNSIAVLPFDSCTADPEDKVLGAALAAESINSLAQTENLKAISRSSSFAFMSAGLTLQQVARPLNVAHLLVGTLCREDGDLTLAVQLAEADGFVLGTESFLQPENPVFPQAETLAAKVTAWVNTQLGTSMPRARIRACDKIDAYQLTLVGREYIERGEFERAQVAFEKALERDSNCADALALLAYARTLALASPPINQAEILTEQEVSARQALAMRPDSELSVQSLVRILGQLGHAEAAEQVLREALASQPRSAGLNAALAGSLVQQERYPAARVAAQRALRLNPSESEAWLAYNTAVRREEGIAAGIRILESWLEQDPLNIEPVDLLGWHHYWMGNYHQAMRTYDRLRVLPDFPPGAWRSQYLIAVWSGRLDKGMELALDMLENGGDDLNNGYVRWELCNVATEVLGTLGLHEEMNHWMAWMDRVDVQNGGHFLYNIRRLQRLGEWEEAAQLAKKWRDELGPDWANAFQSRIFILHALARGGEYQGVVDLIEGLRDVHGEFYADETVQWYLAAAYRRLGDEEKVALYFEATKSELAEQEENIIDGEVRAPMEVWDLAISYAFAGRYEDALAALEMIVEDIFFRFWDDPLGVWAPLEADPRFQEIIEIVEADFERQARHVKAMLSDHDIDVLLAQMVSQ